NYPTNGNSLHEIRVCKSTDGGKTWETMKPVASHTAHMTGYNQNEIRGLWSQFLFETSKGDIQCYYDDENVCWEAGYKGHQWWMMKTLDKEKREWSEPVCVSRTYGNLLARDGMGAVAETSDGTLVAVFESVNTNAPHKGCIRIVTSSDYGKTWNYCNDKKQDTRKIVYAPKDKNYSALQPWIAVLPGDVLMCVFITDEENQTADDVSSGNLNMISKYVLSYDKGKTWEGPYTIDPDPPVKAPTVTLLKYGRNKGMLIYQARYSGQTVRRFGEIKEQE
ncbi:MAG: exo-alpha-sialidase, partial [Clostridia bacterium]|nr:exo-alpha-sialidase [Clostridia bacterium]